LIRDIAYRSSVPVEGELLRSVSSRSLVVSKGGGVVVRDREGIFSVERTVIGEIGYVVVARKDDHMLLAVKAFSQALIEAVVHSTRGICRVCKWKRESNTQVNVCFRGPNRPTSSGYSIYDQCGGR
jgi:hypothetical protein